MYGFFGLKRDFLREGITFTSAASLFSTEEIAEDVTEDMRYVTHRDQMGLGLLLTHEEVDKAIAALQKYKKDFKQKDIVECNAPLSQIEPHNWGEWLEKSENVIRNKFLSIISKKKSKSGFVYLIQRGDSDVYKIGYSRNPHQRLKHMQTAHSDVLRLTKSFETTDMAGLESHLHRLLAAQRLSGEWFELTAIQIQIVEASASDYNDKQLTD